MDGKSPYGEVAALAILLGASARVKILAALLGEDHRDISVATVASLAGVHKTTVYDHLDELESYGVVVNTREVSGSAMYQLNHDHPVVQNLKRLQESIIDTLSKDSRTGNRDPTDCISDDDRTEGQTTNPPAEPTANSQ